jgi:hypothetical protein
MAKTESRSRLSSAGEEATKAIARISPRRLLSGAGKGIMQIQVGNWVRTKTGEVGEVIAIAKLSAFVKIPDGPTETVGYLLSELTRLDPPTNTLAPPHTNEQHT